jgi:hypothetical protein
MGQAGRQHKGKYAYYQALIWVSPHDFGKKGDLSMLTLTIREICDSEEALNGKAAALSGLLISASDNELWLVDSLAGYESRDALPVDDPLLFERLLELVPSIGGRFAYCHRSKLVGTITDSRFPDFRYAIRDLTSLTVAVRDKQYVVYPLMNAVQ